jgi:type II secretory pathway component GspD/PulD (secretin)
MKAVGLGLAMIVLLLGVTASASANEGGHNTCRKLPPGKRLVKLSLKPDTEIGDLVAWISSITCAQFLLPGSLDLHSKKVTIIAPEPITAEEAYGLFLDALDSVELTVVREGRFLRVIETAKAKTSAIPFYVGDADDLERTSSLAAMKGAC